MIMVTDVDERPNFVTKAVAVLGDPTPSFSENASGTVADYNAGGGQGGGAVWMVTGTDASAFDIDGNGMLTFKMTPDYEMKSTYQVTVVATSGMYSDSLDVTVTIGNVDEAGEVTLWRNSVDATYAAPMIDDEITGLVVDPDGGPTNEVWQWSKSDSMNGPFTNIAGATNAAYTVMEADAEMYLRLTAIYDDAQGTGKNAVVVTAMVGGTGTTPPPGTLLETV